MDKMKRSLALLLAFLMLITSACGGAYVYAQETGTGGYPIKTVGEKEKPDDRMRQAAGRSEVAWYYEVYYQDLDGSFIQCEYAQGGTAAADKTVSISHTSFDGEELGWNDIFDKEPEKLASIMCLTKPIRITDFLRKRERLQDKTH